MAPGFGDDSRTVQNHEIPLGGPIVEDVNKPCDEFLAGAAFPENQHGGFAEPRGFNKFPEKRPPYRAFAHDGVNHRGHFDQMVYGGPAFKANLNLSDQGIRIGPGQHVRGAGLQKLPRVNAFAHPNRI